VYAYTTSPVQQSILRLFVRCDALLPNLFVGTLTRESVKGALEVGIAAEQIIAYLRQHAHPRVAQRTPILPIVSAVAACLASQHTVPCPALGVHREERLLWKSGRTQG
jgi:hypothetical protein